MKTTKTHSQNRLMRIITIPIRVLSKAKDMYVRGMNSAERMGYGSMGVPDGQFTSLPKSFSCRSSRLNENDDFSELIRAASARSYGSRIDVDAILRQQVMRQTTTKTGSKVLPKCSSVGMGKIDEDSPCDFGDDGGNLKADLFPRSRSYAVTKRRVGF
ncbi:uncharacterized protein LOC107433686 [Ziziphus jujuba]|uniref:Uncharacterized protein LOC107433686 n=1 Tax=Ziziphus jujuba TaxID=326968 RepID=A0A6P4AX41_ZIZJJ|nr:uncharacterized protein LOC107433686 [Ziziphus jujuba]